jgi:hypothetical protein
MIPVSKKARPLVCAAAMLLATLCAAQAPLPQLPPARPVVSTTMPPQGGDGIGFKDVTSAYEALEKAPGVKISIKEGGWTIAEDRANLAVWSFAPAGHPAYPSVIKRVFLQDSGKVRIDMKAICQAKKPDCDKLIADFEDDNRMMIKAADDKARGKP